jgi:hypothetical protein
MPAASRVAVGRRLPALRVVPAAGAEEVAGAGADVLQPDGPGEAGEEADGAGRMGGASSQSKKASLPSRASQLSRLSPMIVALVDR